ncbi:DUF3796 domain-containing protein [Anaerocolumna sp. AGMB13025]|uniref:DUF3796 domain-containing protein n=1 Tax=Anaerocolumna sp. AGMB13025 TaxID=3039116 RepID=UPI00241BE8CE|nr:DUF3796 domain-containing protein [Anaerocolumna sp. AGMB13025]WFR56992.1 DUF3796 domain-containing protein [Anaerocolumna sp. AGMB13025]
MLKNKKYYKYNWLLGFIGFLGFKYFENQNTSMLFFFSFFGLFSNCIVSKLAAEMPDERYVSNRQKAKNVAMLSPGTALFIIGISSLFPFGTKDFMVLISAFGWAATFLTYSIAFYYYEKH